MINRSPNAKSPNDESLSEDEGSFGDFVRTKRLAAQISLKDFAKRIEVSPAYWSCVETNKEKPPVSELIERAAQVLGENADDYFIRARRLPPDMADPKALETVIRYYRRQHKKGNV
jgi:transcriptional regulator with XRE-family HTH domain